MSLTERHRAPGEGRPFETSVDQEVDVAVFGVAEGHPLFELMATGTVRSARFRFRRGPPQHRDVVLMLNSA